MRRTLLAAGAAIAMTSGAAAQDLSQRLAEQGLLGSWVRSDGPPRSFEEIHQLRRACDVFMLDRTMEGRTINNDALIAALPASRDAVGDLAFIRSSEGFVRLRKSMFGASADAVELFRHEIAGPVTVFWLRRTAEWNDEAWVALEAPETALQLAGELGMARLQMLNDAANDQIHAVLEHPFLPVLVAPGQELDNTVYVRCGDLKAELDAVRAGFDAEAPN